MGWRYTVKTGKQLREAIDGGNLEEILDNLEEVWREIHNRFPKEYDEYDLENDLSDIDGVREDGDEEDVDMLLSDLYDYCDNTRLFIEL